MNKIQKMAACLFLLLAITNVGKVKAQLAPMGSQFFSNQYLANPALAGVAEGLTLDGAVRKQYSNIPGAPSTQTFTAGYQMNSRVGWGLNIYNDAAGLIRKTRVVGSYAYHLPLNSDNSRLHFGVSMGFMNERIGSENVDGDPGDVALGRFNERDTYVDGDFGAAYTSKHLSIQAAIPNMKSFFGTDDNNEADHSTFFSSLSYKWLLSSGTGAIVLEPKVVYRGVRGYDNLLDAGVNLITTNNQLTFTGMYHSSQSATFGMGVTLSKGLSLLGMYTTQTAAMQGYANGNFEAGLKYQVLKNRKVE